MNDEERDMGSHFIGAISKVNLSERENSPTCAGALIRLHCLPVGLQIIGTISDFCSGKFLLHLFFLQMSAGNAAS